MDKNECKGSWEAVRSIIRDLICVCVFIYIAQKMQVWKMVKSQGKVREFCNENQMATLNIVTNLIQMKMCFKNLYTLKCMLFCDY